MNFLIEEWTETKKWLDLSNDERKAYVNGVLSAVGPLLESGMTLVGAGMCDKDILNTTHHRYFAIWSAEDPKILKQFLEILAENKWFNYFDQTNVSGLGQELGEVLQHQMALAN